MDFHILLSGRRGIAAQVYRQVRDAVLEGRLRAGDALPSSRELAQRLGVSRNTIVTAYDRLLAEGFLEAQQGSGTFVNKVIQAQPASRPRSPLQARPVWDGIAESPEMTMPAKFDFRPGIPDINTFPFARWQACWNRQPTRRVLRNGAHIGAAGDVRLRTVIAHHIGVSRGVMAQPSDVFITSGSQQAIELIARLLLEPGDTVAVEDPGYPLIRRAFLAHGCRVVGVPVDDEGLVVDELPDHARLVYATPSHQYPLGMTLSMSRRQALLAWADLRGAAVIEDDYDTEFRFGGRPLESLHRLDGGRHVLYVGSFSKSLLPALRLGFAVLPPSLHAAFRKAKQVSDWHTSVPLQGAVAQFIEDGHLVRHVRRTRQVYEQRHERIVEVLARDFSGLLQPIASHCGLHLAAMLESTDTAWDRRIVAEAATRSLQLLALSPHYLSLPPRAGLLLGFGAVPLATIGQGMQCLREVVQQTRERTRP